MLTRGLKSMLGIGFLLVVWELFAECERRSRRATVFDAAQGWMQMEARASVNKSTVRRWRG